MNGIDAITARILADAQAEADELLAQARSRTQEVTAQAEAQARKESEEILERAGTAAAERRERLESAARMEGSKRLLAVRQELLAKAFDRALEMMCALPEEQYIDLLAGLCAKAAVTGRETIILSAADRKKVGSKVVSKANALLSGGQLTLSDETRPIRGGVILADGGVEVNCAFETLVRLARPALERQVAGVLFDE